MILTVCLCTCFSFRMSLSTSVSRNFYIFRTLQLVIKFSRFEIYAESITREAKRGVSAGSTKKHDVIDEDMLPPSDSDEDVSEEEERAEKIEELNDDSFDLAGLFQFFSVDCSCDRFEAILFYHYVFCV